MLPVSAKLSAIHTLRLTEFLSRRLGLDFPASRQADLEFGIHDACRELGFENAEECIDWLAGARLTRSQIETLASRFTIGETYFFREPEVFAIIEREVLPKLIAERRAAGDRRLRLWSAGCASGEEAYTLAIVVTQLLVDLKEWHVTILGTDLNAQFLRKAAAGIFSDWSFRGLPPGVKERCFEPAGLRLHKISPALRRMVHFGYLNLAEDTYPSLLTNTTAMDLILCRNVLLYFSPERAAAVTKRFHASLNEGGWLVGRHGRTFEAPGFARVSFDQRTLFRKTKEEVVPPEILVIPPLESAPAPAEGGLDAPLFVRPEAAPLELPRPPVPMGIAASSAGDVAYEAANRGLLPEALRYCDEALRSEKSNPRIHYLRATILAELGAFAEAEAAFGRTLYLDPEYLLAHFALASLTYRLGKTSESRRHLQNASVLLAKLDPDAILPGLRRHDRPRI